MEMPPSESTGGVKAGNCAPVRFQVGRPGGQAANLGTGPREPTGGRRGELSPLNKMDNQKAILGKRYLKNSPFSEVGYKGIQPL